jgi:hypothetical protein
LILEVFFGEEFLIQIDIDNDIEIFNFFKIQYGLTFDYYVKIINQSLQSLFILEKYRPGKFQRFISSLFSIYISDKNENKMIYIFTQKNSQIKLLYIKSINNNLTYGSIENCTRLISKALKIYRGEDNKLIKLLESIENRL